jgi:MOSC domain-containing protein YiiM
VEAIVLAPHAAAPVHQVQAARAAARRGLQGDRYATGAGTFASGRPGSTLTLIDAAVLDELAAERGAPVDHRRNVVVRGTDLNALVGRTFTLGDLVCEGRRLCEPCATSTGSTRAASCARSCTGAAYGPTS